MKKTLLILSFCLIVVPSLPAQAQQEADSLETLLFEDLETGLSSDPPATSGSGATESEVDRQLRRELEGADAGEDLGQRRRSDPLREVAGSMQRAGDRLSQRDLTTETRQLQKGIVGSLDQLIEALQQSPARSGGQTNQPQEQQQPNRSGKSQPGKPQSGQPQSGRGQGQPADGGASQPAQNSTPRLGTAKSAELDAAARDRLLQQAWGNLPAAVRQQMQSARPETFLPKYAKLIEEYFKRLSEEDRNRR